MGFELTKFFSVTVALGVLAPMGTGATYWKTNPDQKAKLECPKNKMLIRINSKFIYETRDRVFNFKCFDLPLGAHTTSCVWTEYVNDFDKLIIYRCPDQKILSGVSSIHNNKYEDRRYKFKCCTPSGFLVHGCKYTKQYNDYWSRFFYFNGNDRPITGIVSSHNNEKEDRVFWFEYCKLYKRPENPSTEGTQRVVTNETTTQKINED